MATADPITPDTRRFSVLLPRPLWIGVAAVVVVVVAALGATLYRAHEHLRETWNRPFYDDLDRIKAGQQERLHVYDTQGTDRLLKQLRGMAQIEEISLELTDATDDGMKHIAGLPNLRKLVIYGGYSGIGDRGFICFRKCTTLESIKLINTKVTDEGLVILKDLPNLRSLTLFREAKRERMLTDAGLAHLHPLRHLASLRLTGGWASDSAVQNLKQALPQCKIETGDQSDLFDHAADIPPTTPEIPAADARQK